MMFVRCLRHKVHIQVIDITGSTSFIMFDRNVQNHVGISVQDLIDRQNQVALHKCANVINTFFYVCTSSQSL